VDDDTHFTAEYACRVECDSSLCYMMQCNSHVSFMLHLFKYAERININCVAEIGRNCIFA